MFGAMNWENGPESSEIVKRRFCKTVCHTLSLGSGVVRNGRQLRSSSCALVQPSMNCPLPTSDHTVAHKVGSIYVAQLAVDLCWRLPLSVQISDNCTNLTVDGRYYQCHNYSPGHVSLYPKGET